MKEYLTYDYISTLLEKKNKTIEEDIYTMRVLSTYLNRQEEKLTQEKLKLNRNKN